MGLSNNLGKLSNMITSTGSAVGIAQASPAYTLDVTGTGRFTSTLLVSGAATLSSTLAVGTTISAQNGGTYAGSAEFAGILRIQGSGGRYFTSGNGLEFSYNSIYSYNRGTSAYNDLSINDSMVVKGGNGNVGIGITPYAWNSIFLGIDFANKGGVNSYTNYLSLSQNLYYGSGALDGWRYKTSGYGAGITIESDSGSIVFRNTSSSGTADAAASTYAERMRITSGGEVLIGTTSITQSAKVMLSFDGSTKNARVTQTTAGGTGSNFDIFVNSANGVCGYIQQNGTTTVNYSNSSDYRLKENILPIQNAIDRLSKINAVTYTWKDTDNEQGEGFIAHELQEIVPLAVTGVKDAMNQDGTIKAQGIDYAKLTPLLVAAIQELITQNQDLKSRLDKAGL